MAGLKPSVLPLKLEAKPPAAVPVRSESGWRIRGHGASESLALTTVGSGPAVDKPLAFSDTTSQRGCIRSCIMMPLSGRASSPEVGV